MYVDGDIYAKRKRDRNQDLINSVKSIRTPEEISNRQKTVYSIEMDNLSEKRHGYGVESKKRDLFLAF